MKTTRSSVGDSPALIVEGRGSLSLPVRCPECGLPGLVHWTKLQNSIRCPACDCEFLVARGGRIRRVADLPHVRYWCPRCHTSGGVPAQLAARRAKCRQCQLPLARGPDHKLHGMQEAAALWRDCGGRAPRQSWTERLSRAVTADDGRLRRTNVVLLALPLVALAVVVAYGLAAYFDNSLETTARRFTHACLSGSEQAMIQFVEDDAVQLVELKRWAARRFSSIVNGHRPDGDEVDVDVRAVEERSPYRIVLVTLRSPHLGTRWHIQHWRQHDSGWLFDSRATLADEEGPQTPPAQRRQQPHN
jgi:hypothetical protein